MSQASRLVGAIVPGVERHPLKKLTAAAAALLRRLQRWRDEAIKAGLVAEPGPSTPSSPGL